MSSSAKRKGTAFESSVRDYLRAAGFPVERVPAGMVDDRGDLAGLPDWTLELKSYNDMLRAIREGLDDLEREQTNADTMHGAVVVKRRGKSDPRHALVVMDLERFVGVLAMLRARTAA